MVQILDSSSSQALGLVEYNVAIIKMANYYTLEDLQKRAKKKGIPLSKDGKKKTKAQLCRALKLKCKKSPCSKRKRSRSRCRRAPPVRYMTTYAPEAASSNHGMLGYSAGMTPSLENQGYYTDPTNGQLVPLDSGVGDLAYTFGRQRANARGVHSYNNMPSENPSMTAGPGYDFSNYNENQNKQGVLGGLFNTVANAVGLGTTTQT